jgi:cell division protein FtsN
MKESSSLIEEKGSLFVFDKTEVVLILIFVVVIAATSFTIGIRVGKKLLLESKGYSEEALNVELKSTTEEYAENLEKKKNTISDEELQKMQMENMKEELSKLDQKPAVKVEETPKEDIVSDALASDMEPEVKVSENTEDLNETSTNPYIGKYTIQLGSYQNLEDAKNFAEGFVIKGYDPIINKVEIPGKGEWYRVSIGTFESKAQAQQYIEKEQSLFLGKEYRIYQVQ